MKEVVNMANDLSIVLKYIKSYKARSLAIILSVVLGTSLTVGVEEWILNSMGLEPYHQSQV